MNNSPRRKLSLWKRIFDIAFSISILLVFSPLYLLLSLLVYTRMGQPIFFRQDRCGLNGRSFTIIKYRTMSVEVGSDGLPLSDAQRLTSFGKFLRASSMDELPELWNIIRGDMSLVGPRPLLVEYLPLYSTHHARRHEVRPGLTGWAQINGRNALTWDDRLDLDIWYIDNWSFFLDLKILFITLKKVVIREGINEPGQTTQQPFSGSK